VSVLRGFPWPTDLAVAHTFMHVSIHSFSYRRSANFLDTSENSQMTTRKEGMKIFKDHKHQDRRSCDPTITIRTSSSVSTKQYSTVNM